MEISKNSSEDKIVEAIDRCTKEARKVKDEVACVSVWLFLLWLSICIFGCPRAKATPLASDGDEIASVGTVQVITPHSSWAQPLEGSQWISIAQTGWLGGLIMGKIVGPAPDWCPLEKMEEQACVK